MTQMESGSTNWVAVLKSAKTRTGKNQLTRAPKFYATYIRVSAAVAGEEFVDPVTGET